MKWLPLVLFCCILSSCIKFGEPFSGLPPGPWRGVLYLSEDTTGFDEHSGGELPFNFDIVYDNPDSFHMIIHNGSEDIPVTDITMGTDRKTGRDTLWIDFPVYDSHFRIQYQEDWIEGWWVAGNRKDYKIKFKAKYGENFRFFENPDPPKINLTGKWECNFEVETKTPYKAIGDFKQDGNHITGTFLTLTGDDRYLEGQVSGDRLFLSVFDGSHAYLYEAKVLPDGTLSGIYRSGTHYKTYWEGKRNDTIQFLDLGDPLAQTVMKSEDVFSVSLPTPEGQLVNLHHPPYESKPKIIQIMGTWCPNCRDETGFLLDYLKKNPDPGFEILGISFERQPDTLKALKAIQTYRDKLHIPYTIVYGGSNDKMLASEKLPMLNKVMAYPSMIFLSKSDHVVDIHTGFTGPATSEYPVFVKEFDQLVTKMKNAK
jgi:thiol-disulfide isomerase/thioredoxin